MATIGDNIARLRRSKAMTQEQLAEHAGLAVATVSKLERNERTSARLDTVARLARALGVPTTTLVGDASEAAARREPEHRPLSLIQVRQALTPARGLAGSVATAPAGPPPGLDAIRARLRRADQAYHGAAYGSVLAELPELITDARAAAEVAQSDEHGQAHATLSRVLHLTGSLLIQIRAGDLAHAALTASLTAAEAAGDQTLAAAAIKQRCWLLLRQARLAEAEALAVNTADAVEPRMSRAEPAELAVWGWLLMTGAAAAARDQRPGDAAEMFDAAAAATARLADRPIGGDHLLVLDGVRSSAVEMMRVETAAVTGAPDRVVAMAERIRPDDGADATSWQRHRLDVAWACAEMGRWGDATDVLSDLRHRAPAWLRHQRYARDVVRTISDGRRRAMSAELAELAELTGAART
ncbi:helix-turn-helix domain-containing protein [Solwaraspora sp. WMMD1047]|uniref:helix-turn-helix domain-containing protein n=1 Tax=Solwaraspora sp. WMMD1047 TaxID=3016102 RepID=UPI002415B5C5|nr:helix-turn-helix domain-containing protein [Solwaraspora sp. WMMD1047]MDG4832446.1 helix-turn-helix domain-containing protein [Solwaraspora sp. WMMD1047]